MASTNKTNNLQLSQYMATDKPSWLTDYNSDMQSIDAAIAASGVHPASVTTTGNLHTVRYEGEGDTIKFTATAAFALGDRLEINGAQLPVRDCDGNAFTMPPWQAGDTIVVSIGTTDVRVLTPLKNKVDRVMTEFSPVAKPGFTIRGDFYKNNIGEVSINFHGEGPFAPGDVFCTLPAGYRPSMDMRPNAIVYGPDNGFSVASVLISGGDMFLSMSGSGFTQCYFSAHYRPVG